MRKRLEKVYEIIKAAIKLNEQDIYLSKDKKFKNYLQGEINAYKFVLGLIEYNIIKNWRDL